MIPPDLRVCIVAEHASTRFGGEALLPFHYFRVLRKRGVDVWLIVHERTREELAALFPRDLERIRFVEDRMLQRIFHGATRFLPRRIAEASLGLASQLLTQWAQRRIVRSLVTPKTVVHQPIPVSPRFPSLLAGLGAPLIAGPLNGGMEYPPAFREAELWLSRSMIMAARSLSDVVNAVLAGKRNAAVVLVANERTRAALPSGLRGRVIEMAENGVDLSQWSVMPDAPEPGVQPTFLFMGRLVDWKALDIVIEALAHTPGAALEVIGDGPMLHRWRGLALSHGLGARVTFHGWLSQQECAHWLQQARALVLPSLYESGGAVVLEAMASARPVIACAWGGPLEYLDETCGILVEPSSREALVSGFACAMQTLIDSPETALRLGRCGRARSSEHFDWEKKVDRMLDIYRSVLPGETDTG